MLWVYAVDNNLCRGSYAVENNVNVTHTTHMCCGRGTHVLWMTCYMMWIHIVWVIYCGYHDHALWATYAVGM